MVFLLCPAEPRCILRTGGMILLRSDCEHQAAVSPGSCGVDGCRRCLLAVKLDDELLVDGQIDVFALWQREDLAREIVAVDVQPLHGTLAAGEVLRLFEDGNGFGTLAQLDLVAYLALEGRDVDLAAIHLDVAVTDELTGLAAREGEAEAIADVVQAGLKLLEEQLTGDAGAVGGLLVVGA